MNGPAGVHTELLERLPVAIEPAPGEAIDSYLERVAEANNLTPTQVRDLTPATTVTRLRRGQKPGRLHAQERPAPDGWAHGAIVQACPSCLTEQGVWFERWYDPMVTACLTHHCLLIAECPGCRRRLRDNPHTWVRPAGAATLCANPLAGGQGPRCPIDLAAVPPGGASEEVLRQQEQQMLETPVMLGHETTRGEYRASLKALAVLLLSIAAASPTPPVRWSLPPTKRWALRPPPQPDLRAEFLAVADGVLSQPSSEQAAEVLQPWFAAIPSVWEGPLSWAFDHTNPNPIVRQIVTAAAAPKRRLSYRLGHANFGTQLPGHQIPQCIPPSLAAEIGETGLGDTTARAFAALCLARTSPTVTSWAHAATLIRLPEGVGVDLARTANARLAIGHDEWCTRISALSAALAREAVDYRRREQLTRRVSADRLLQALQRVRPGTRASSCDLIRRWIWEHWAGGHPGAGPILQGVTRRAAAARYAQFENGLKPAHCQILFGAMTRVEEHDHHQ